jgi:L-2-hydroxycarboxylate dehydrogenase (NAD+)
MGPGRLPLGRTTVRADGTVTDLPDDLIGLDADAVLAAATASLVGLGVPADDAAETAATLIRSQLDGATGHGLVRLPVMLDRLRSGVTNPDPQLRVLHEAPAVLVLDADRGLGQVVAVRAMRRAVDRAARYGVGFVTVRESSHMGRARDAALVAAEQGMVGLVISNASPRLVRGPGSRRLLGNNPLACAVPGRERPVVVDVSPGVTTVGSIRLAALEGRPLPDGWGLDVDGNPTNDAEAAFAGGMLAIGGHKGWVLALLADLLTGVLSGGAIASEVGPTQSTDREQRVSHSFLAIDPAAMAGLGTVHDRLDDLRDMVVAAGGEPARLPGEGATNDVSGATMRVRPALAQAVVTALRADGSDITIEHLIASAPDAAQQGIS